MSIPPTEPLFADSNSLSYAYKAGGSNLLDSYLAAADAQGMSLTITDQRVGWVEHLAKPIASCATIDGYRFAPPILPCPYIFNTRDYGDSALNAKVQLSALSP